MKLKNIFFTGLIAVTGLSGCDEVANPIKSKQIIGILPTTPPSDTNSSKNPNVYKMLLEDCTGHLCTNCPLAATDAEAVLRSSFGNQVILMEDNVGFDAIPQDTVNGCRLGAFLTDYRCVAGNNWCTDFNMNSVGFPYGMTNREGAEIGHSTFVLYNNYYDSCNTLVTIRNTTPAVTIDIHDSVWTSPRIMGATFKLNFLKTLSGGSYLLETCIVEDSIEDWQDDNGVFDSTYMKRYTLRGSFDLNGNGVTIPVTTAGTTWTSFQTYNFATGENGKAGGTSNSKPWNIANCYIVAFVYSSGENTNNPWEIVQAEMIKIAPHLYP
ncbi:MAG TPA: hypothetical protein VK808_03790 [Bacteroidia bacterium]|nr:hypothetical protein [Bacteroidia bacterium]